MGLGIEDEAFDSIFNKIKAEHKAKDDTRLDAKALKAEYTLTRVGHRAGGMDGMDYWA